MSSTVFVTVFVNNVNPAVHVSAFTDVNTVSVSDVMYCTFSFIQFQ